MRGPVPRPQAVALLLVVTLALGASAIPVLGQSLGGPGSGEDPVLARALASLEGLTVFRMEQESTSVLSGSVPITVVSERVTEPQPATRFQIVDAGEVAMEQIQIGEDAGWTQVLGGRWEPRDASDPLSSGSRPPVRPAVLGRLLEHGIGLTEVGAEAVDGTATIHHRGELMTPAGTPAPGAPSVQAVAGTLDLWVARDTGRLVRSEADIEEVGLYGSMLGQDPIRTREVVRISRVDDPTLAITPPDLTAASPSIAPGDSALAAAVLGAVTALDELGSFRATLVERAIGYAGTMDLVVVNHPEQVVQARFGFGERTFRELLATGDRVWSRGGDEEPWQEAIGTDEISCSGEACDVDWLTGFDRVLDGLLDTFTVVADEELLDGVPVRHLRSEAGQVLPQNPRAPGVTDVWIARDGGHLLKLTFDGQGVRSTVTISEIDDPANVVESPPVDSPAASASRIMSPPPG